MSDLYHLPDSDEVDQYILDEIEIETTESLDKPVVGSPYEGPVEIIVDTSAWRQVNQHVREDMRYESGGILLGSIHETDNQLTIRITNSVPARETINSITTVEFTIDAWRHMDSERERQDDNNKLLGWYHTHPNFSAFFSKTDYFMHERFFTEPWHVALVIDPVQEEYLFYRWDNGQVVECPNFLLQVHTVPDVRYPATASMVNSIARGLGEMNTEEQKSYKALRQSLIGLSSRIQQHASGSSLVGLLSTLIEVNNFDRDAIDQARQLVQSHVALPKEITMDDLQAYTSPLPAMKKAVIKDDWLLLLTKKERFFALDLMTSLPVRHKLKLKHDVLDVTLNQENTPIFLTSDQDAPLLLMAPNLDIQRNSIIQQRIPRNRLGRMKIDWRDNPLPTSRIERCINGNHVIYLLTAERIYLLVPDVKGTRLQYICSTSYTARDCGIDRFDLADWTTDTMGNVFMIDKQKHVLMFNYPQMRWHKVIFDQPPVNPRFVSASWLYFTVFDAGPKPQLISFDILTRKQISQVHVTPEIFTLDPSGMYSDGGTQLLWITQKGIYLSKWRMNV